MKAALKAAGLLKVMLELLELLFGLLRKSYEYPNYVRNVLKAKLAAYWKKNGAIIQIVKEIFLEYNRILNKLLSD